MQPQRDLAPVQYDVIWFPFSLDSVAQSSMCHLCSSPVSKDFRVQFPESRRKFIYTTPKRLFFIEFAALSNLLFYTIEGPRFT